MTIAIGDMLPAATLVRMTVDGPEKVETKDYFAGRRMALFSVPGAFTPTCSAKHLPGFIEKADAIKSRGIDEIVVMGAWGESAGAEGKVTLLADGNGDFVKALGLDFDGSAFGMGRRGKRFAMVVDDGKVEKLFVEAPGEFRVSSAEYLLAEL
jgi:peroxiredoxin